MIGLILQYGVVKNAQKDKEKTVYINVIEYSHLKITVKAICNTKKSSRNIVRIVLI